jgi:hypothetical protein
VVVGREAVSNSRSHTDGVPILRTALVDQLDGVKLSSQSADTLLVKDAASLLNFMLGLIPMPVVYFNPEAFFKQTLFCPRF